MFPVEDAAAASGTNDTDDEVTDPVCESAKAKDEELGKDPLIC